MIEVPIDPFPCDEQDGCAFCKVEFGQNHKQTCSVLVPGKREHKPQKVCPEISSSAFERKVDESEAKKRISQAQMKAQAQVLVAQEHGGGGLPMGPQQVELPTKLEYLNVLSTCLGAKCYRWQEVKPGYWDCVYNHGVPKVALAAARQLLDKAHEQVEEDEEA